MFDANIETAPGSRGSQSPLLVRCDDRERNASRIDCSEFRNRQLPCREDLQQERFKTLIYLVQLVDEKNAGLLAFECPHQWTRAKEVSTFEVRHQIGPVRMLAFAVFHVQPLQALVVVPDGLLLRQTLVALKSFDVSSGRIGDG